MDMIRNLYHYVFASCPGVTNPMAINVKLLCLGAIKMHPTQSPTCAEIFAWAESYYYLTATPDEKKAKIRAFHQALSRGKAQEPPIFFEIGPEVKGGKKRWTFAPLFEIPPVSDLPLHLLNSSSDSSSSNSDGAMSVESDSGHEVTELARSMAVMYTQASCHKYVLPEIIELMTVLKPGPKDVNFDIVADIIIRYAKYFVSLGWEPATKDEIAAFVEAFEKEGVDYVVRDLFMTDDPVGKQLIVAQKGPWDPSTKGIKSMTVSAFTEISRFFLCLNVKGVHKQSYPDFRAVTRSNNVVIYTNVKQVCKCHVAIFLRAYAAVHLLIRQYQAKPF